MKTVFVNRLSNQGCAAKSCSTSSGQDGPEAHKTPGDSSELL